MKSLNLPSDGAMNTRRRFDSLRIRRFRGLADISLDGLGAFNLLLGANDVGKTSVLETIFLLTGLSNVGLPIQVQNNREYDVLSFEDLSFLFHDLDTDSSIELSGTLRNKNGENEARRLQISAPEANLYADPQLSLPGIRRQENGNGVSESSAPARISSSSLPGQRSLRYTATINDGSDSLEQQTFDGELDFSSSEGIQFRTRSTEQQSLIVPALLVSSRASYRGTAIQDLVINKLDEELLKILCPINPQIEKFAASGDTIYIDIGLEKMIPLNMFGSGMARAAHVFSHCILGKSQVLLIDEVENGLHHEGLSVFLKALLAVVAERSIQVFATTHRLELLTILQSLLRKEEYLSMRAESKCFVFARNKDGQVVPYKYDYEEFDHCIQHGIEIR